MLLFIVFSCYNKATQEKTTLKKVNDFAIITHGRAGTILKKNITPEKEKMKAEQTHDAKIAFYDPEIKDSKYGTVGCVALDKNGNITAGTSTGGVTNKRWNRIGDTPIIGSGTYANNKTCGVSSTGWGEYFIRAQVAFDISALMEYKNLTLKEVTTEVIQYKR